VTEELESMRLSDIKMQALPKRIPWPARIVAAIKKEWPRSHPHYWHQITWRYCKAYPDISVTDAIKAIRAGYSSPSAAMWDGIIPWSRIIRRDQTVRIIPR
jgi:hypothetical protein